MDPWRQWCQSPNCWATLIQMREEASPASVCLRGPGLERTCVAVCSSEQNTPEMPNDGWRCQWSVWCSAVQPDTNHSGSLTAKHRSVRDLSWSPGSAYTQPFPFPRLALIFWFVLYLGFCSWLLLNLLKAARTGCGSCSYHLVQSVFWTGACGW